MFQVATFCFQSLCWQANRFWQKTTGKHNKKKLAYLDWILKKKGLEEGRERQIRERWGEREGKREREKNLSSVGLHMLITAELNLWFVKGMLGAALFAVQAEP